MGAIKDGTVSGFLPNTKAFAVHHPGYPFSMSRAIDSLGGPEAILRVHSSHLNRLELHFRPEDPYSHPVYGELQPCNNLLLKISKKKSVNMFGSGMSNGSTTGLSEGPSICSSKSADYRHQTNQHVNKSLSACGKDEAANLENVQAEVSADIVARVLDAYHFNGMVDYQYVLPVHANAERTKKRSWMEEAPPSGQGDLKNMYHEDLLILLPQLFSPKDVPEKVVLRPPFLASSKNKQERVVQQRWEMDIEPCFAIDFNTEDILNGLFCLNYVRLANIIYLFCVLIVIRWCHGTYVASFLGLNYSDKTNTCRSMVELQNNFVSGEVCSNRDFRFLGRGDFEIFHRLVGGMIVTLFLWMTVPFFLKYQTSLRAQSSSLQNPGEGKMRKMTDTVTPSRGVGEVIEDPSFLEHEFCEDGWPNSWLFLCGFLCTGSDQPRRFACLILLHVQVLRMPLLFDLVAYTLFLQKLVLGGVGRKEDIQNQESLLRTTGLKLCSLDEKELKVAYPRSFTQGKTEKDCASLRI